MPLSGLRYDEPKHPGGRDLIVYADPDMSADAIRSELYAGNLVLLSAMPAVADLVDYTRDQLSSLFAPHEPEHVHEHLEPAELASLLGRWKPQFIRDPKAVELVREITRQVGFSADQTYLDLPRVRTSYPVGHLTTGVAYAFPYHRDTWYSAPQQQLNWWLPIYPVVASNAMSFDPASFARPVDNSSSGFDYYEINVARHSTATQVVAEVQSRPSAQSHSVEAGAEVVVVAPVGSVLLFSGSQLHASIPNRSGIARYSVDFRTVDLGDLLEGRGAPAVDVRCTGTSIRDFRRVRDDAPMDEATVVSLFGPPPEGAELIFQPS